MQSGAVNEDVAVTAGHLDTSGAVTFTEFDTADVHTAAFAPQAVGSLGTFALVRSFPTRRSSDLVGWSFQVADGATDYLAAGQTLTQKYDVTVDDGQGGTAVQTVTIRRAHV